MRTTLIIYSALDGDNIATYVGGAFTLEGGTSASSPIFAALVNRIIEERIKVGKGPVGFINPVLYEHPEVLNDIVNGTNPGCEPTKTDNDKEDRQANVRCRSYQWILCCHGLGSGNRFVIPMGKSLP